MITHHAYQFAHHANVPAEPPLGDYHTTLCERVWDEKPLSRDEKDRIAQMLYGPCGSQGPVYKQAGWAWDLRDAPHMRAFLVSFRDDLRTYRVYYAPDKTSLRRTLTRVVRIIEDTKYLKRLK